MHTELETFVIQFLECSYSIQLYGATFLLLLPVNNKLAILVWLQGAGMRLKLSWSMEYWRRRRRPR